MAWSRVVAVQCVAKIFDQADGLAASEALLIGDNHDLVTTKRSTSSIGQLLFSFSAASFLSKTDLRGDILV